jgi:hypothetical protein
MSFLRGFHLALFPLESPPAAPINKIDFLKTNSKLSYFKMKQVNYEINSIE